MPMGDSKYLLGRDTGLLSVAALAVKTKRNAQPRANPGNAVNCETRFTGMARARSILRLKIKLVDVVLGKDKRFAEQDVVAFALEFTESAAGEPGRAWL